MPPLQHEIESFLIAEVGVGLANISAHLEWASATAGEEVRLSREGVANIVANLRRIEFRAELLSGKLINGRAPRFGVEDTLRRFALDVA